MKLRWPKFLTVKRTILFALLLFVLIFALVYFLGGYKASALTDDRMPFDSEGFVSIDKYIEDEVKVNVQKFDALLNELTVSNFDEKIKEVEKACKTADFLSKLDSKVEELSKQDTSREFNHKVKTDDLISPEQLAKQTMDEFRPCIEKLDSTKTGYVLKLNYFSTQFKIIRMENGVAVNEWYSNPQNLDYANNLGSTLSNQNSPLILYYYTPNGASLPYSAYEYSINDNLGDKDTPNYVDQTFSYKFDATNGTLQVYYDLQTKGDKYYNYPQYLTEDRLNELIQRNKDYIKAELPKIKSWTEKELQDYFNLHYSVKYIRNQYGTGKIGTANARDGYIGVEAYKYYVDRNQNKVDDDDYAKTDLFNLPAKFKALSHQQKIAYIEIMFRLEYEFISNNKHDFMKALSFHKDYKIITRRDTTTIQTEYVKDDTLKDAEHPYVFYKIENYSGMSTRTNQLLKEVILKKLLYTKEDLEADQSLFNVEVVENTPSFKVAVQYTLTENGFEAKIINNSLYESLSEKYPIYKIDILPYFSAIGMDYAPIVVEGEGKPYYDLTQIQESNGYMIIPDGSGGIVNLNNGKLSYQKRVYSTDLAFIDEVKKTASEDVLLPMYALTYDSINFSKGTGSFQGSSIIARVTNGAPQMFLNAGVSSGSDSYNKIYFSATYRESQTVTIGTGYYATPVTQVTPTNVKTDFTVDYSLINEQGLTYSDIAKRYQTMLLGDILDKNVTDKTNETVLNAEYLGLYDFTTNFLGIVYDGYDTLTTFNQAVTITKQLKDWNAKNINVIYLGWQDSGLVNETFNDMKFTKDLGTKKELQSMLDYFDQNNVTLYPNVSFLEVNKINESFGKIRYASRDISNEFTEKYPYDLASGIFDKQQRPIYTISPKFFKVFADNLVENFTKNNPSLGNMAFEKLGSKIVGDYKKRQEFFRYNSVVEQINMFENLNANNISNLTLTAPYEFAVKYTNNIVELPYSSTLLDIFDYSIPFYQLVFSGYRDYSGLIINANDEKGLNYHIMKILETGSNIEFTFSFDDSNELIQTDYNYYYYTHYIDWQREVQSLTTVLDTLELHKYYLASHELVGNNSSVFKVTYKVKDECKSQVTDSEFSIYLNYSDMNVNISNELTYIDIENNDAQYNPFKEQTTGGILNPWSCATDKEVA